MCVTSLLQEDSLHFVAVHTSILVWGTLSPPRSFACLIPQPTASAPSFTSHSIRQRLHTVSLLHCMFSAWFSSMRFDVPPCKPCIVASSWVPWLVAHSLRGPTEPFLEYFCFSRPITAFLRWRFTFASYGMASVLSVSSSPGGCK